MGTGVWSGRRKRRGGGGGRWVERCLCKGYLSKEEDGMGEEVGCIRCGDLLHISVVPSFV